MKIGKHQYLTIMYNKWQYNNIQHVYKSQFVYGAGINTEWVI